jgi:hypothetical protein
MLVQIVVLLGCDDRALYIARRLTFLIMWLSEWDIKRLILNLNHAIEQARKLKRAA